MPSAVVCDDDEVSRRILTGMLRDQGYEVIGEATMATEALQLVAVTKPDVLVLDVSLPGMPGTEIVKDVRLRSPRTAVIMVSAFDVSEVEENAIDHPDAVLTKTELADFDHVLSSVMARR